MSRYADSVAVVGEDLLATEISCALANKGVFSGGWWWLVVDSGG